MDARFCHAARGQPLRRRRAALLVALAAATAMVFVIIKGLDYAFVKLDEMDTKQPGTQLNTGPVLPPEPRLQGAPEPDPNNPGQTRMSALPLDDIEQRARTRNGQCVGASDLCDICQFVVRIGHQPARGGLDAKMAGAPMVAERFQVTPPLPISKMIGSGLLAFGSSIVTRNLRPPTSFK